MVIIGVDPHQTQHSAVALDSDGRILGRRCLPNHPKGFASLAEWAAQFSQPRWAIEGAANYFTLPLSRYLAQQGAKIYNIHPALTSQYRSRVERRKDDQRDAAHAARALLANPRGYGFAGIAQATRLSYRPTCPRRQQWPCKT